MSVELRKVRFPKEMLETKPGPGGRQLTYVDKRNIEAMLDSHAPDWVSTLRVERAGEKFYAICTLAVDGVVREDVGDGDTVFDAGNQAFRRAAAAHGLGAYLWTGETAPVAPDLLFPSRDAALAWAMDTGVFKAPQHAEHAYEIVKRAVLAAAPFPLGSMAAAAVFTAWKAEVDHRVQAANEGGSGE